MTFKRIIAANGVDEQERYGSVPEFLVISRQKISPHGANNNEHELQQTSAYTSECQISPKISRTLAYAGPIRYSVTGPLNNRIIK